MQKGPFQNHIQYIMDHLNVAAGKTNFNYFILCWVSEPVIISSLIG